MNDLSSFLNHIAAKFYEERDYFERNNHMHLIKVTPPLEEVTNITNKFIDFVCSLGIKPTIKIDLLNFLTDSARVFRKNFSENQEIVDCVLTGFINSVGMEMWVDYALYSSDLAKDEKTHSRAEYM